MWRAPQPAASRILHVVRHRVAARINTVENEQLKVGMRLRVEWSGAWWAATVKEDDADRIKVSFNSWSSKYDEWLPRDSTRLRIPAADDVDPPEFDVNTKTDDPALGNTLAGVPTSLPVQQRIKPYIPKPFNAEKEFQKRQLRLKEKIAAMQQVKLGAVDPALGDLAGAREAARQAASGEHNYQGTVAGVEMPVPGMPATSAPVMQGSAISSAPWQSAHDMVPPTPPMPKAAVVAPMSVSVPASAHTTNVAIPPAPIMPGAGVPATAGGSISGHAATSGASPLPADTAWASAKAPATAGSAMPLASSQFEVPAPPPPFTSAATAAVPSTASVDLGSAIPSAPSVPQVPGNVVGTAAVATTVATATAAAAAPAAAAAAAAAAAPPAAAPVAVAPTLCAQASVAASPVDVTVAAGLQTQTATASQTTKKQELAQVNAPQAVVSWEECLSDQKERYYHELATGKVSWDLPQEGWVELIADDGRRYYWEPVADTTQWTRPGPDATK